MAKARKPKKRRKPIQPEPNRPEWAKKHKGIALSEYWTWRREAEARKADLARRLEEVQAKVDRCLPPEVVDQRKHAEHQQWWRVNCEVQALDVLPGDDGEAVVTVVFRTNQVQLSAGDFECFFVLGCRRSHRMRGEKAPPLPGGHGPQDRSRGPRLKAN